jgi:site-specific DNA-methyltransferase (adenine-specific)
MTKQISILDGKEEQNATELYSVLPTVKKAIKHEPKIELLNIDCLHYMKQCEDKQFDLAIVDPPYGIGEDGLKNHSRNKLAQATKYTPKDWDKEIPSKEYFTELRRVSKNQIVWGGNYFVENLTNSSCWVVWDKDNSGDFADCELAWTSFDTAVRKLKWRWNGMIQQNMKNKEVRIHPTQKPKALYEYLLMNYAKEGNKILDTHLGSGSIALACYDLKFDLVGCEIDNEYFVNANNRLNQHKKQLTLF